MLKEKFDVEAELIESGGGIFDVTVDGDVIFSRKQEGRFPEEDEVVDSIRQRG